MPTITQPGGASYARPDKVQHVKIELTSAEILALNTTPLEIIPAPGAGKTIKLISAAGKLTFLTAAYATNVNLQLITDTATIAQYDNAIALTSTATRMISFAPVAATGATSTQHISNKSVKVTVATGNPVTGAGTLTLYVAYSTIAD